MMPNAWIQYGRSLALATAADVPLNTQALGSGPRSLSPARTLSPPPDRASRAAPVDAVTLLFQALDSDGVRTLRSRYATPRRRAACRVTPPGPPALMLPHTPMLHRTV